MDQPGPKITEFKAKVLPGFENLPAIYRHRPLAEQIKEYRRILDEIWIYEVPFEEQLNKCKSIIKEAVNVLYNHWELAIDNPEKMIAMLLDIISKAREQKSLEFYMDEVGSFLKNHSPPETIERMSLYIYPFRMYTAREKAERGRKINFGAIPDLFGILENAVALAHYYITTDSSDSRINKIPYLECLNIIWLDIKNKKNSTNS